MQIELKKKLLSAIEKFLMGLKMSGKVSRARIKLCKSIVESLEELREDAQHIKKENEDDELEYKKQVDELLEEKAVIDLTKYKALMNELYLNLDELDVEMDGEDGYIHDVLLNAFEENHTKLGDDE